MVDDHLAGGGGADVALRGALTEAVPESGEQFRRLAQVGPVRIEHIVSSDAPDTGEQVQDGDEWVLLLSGAAELEIAGELLHLGRREWVLIPAGTPHRVVGTRAGTHWIAVHGQRAAPPPPT